MLVDLIVSDLSLGFFLVSQQYGRDIYTTLCKRITQFCTKWLDVAELPGSM
jgi:hypothetical protein